MLRLIFAVLVLHIGVASTTDDNRIIGGRPATDGEFPYQLSLRRLPSTRHFCGGSLITPGHVLTAAHCMYYMWGGELPPMVVRVVAGQLNLTLTPSSLYRDVVKITIHEGYERVSMSNDVAILDLSKPFDLNPTIVFVIPLRRTPVNSGSCVVSGWGSEKFEWNNVSEILLTAEVDIIGRKKCADLYGNGTIVDSMLCAGVENGERDACQGDSGGPLVCDGVLTGVVSTGKGCGNPQYPGVYANIPHLLPWIQKHTNLIPQTSALESDQFKTTTTQLEEIEIMNAFVRFLESFRRNSATKPNLTYVAITLCSVLLFSIK